MPIAGALSISGDGRIAAHITDTREVVVWNTADSKVQFTIDSGDKKPSVVALNSDGTRLAIGHALSPVELHSLFDQKEISTAVEIWSLIDQKEISTITVENNWVTSLAFSPDSTRLALGKGHTGVVEIWNLASGRNIGDFPSKFSPEGWFDLGVPISVGFTGNGQALIVNEWYHRHYNVERAATLWDIPTGLELSARHVTPPGADSIVRPGLALGLDGWLLVYTMRKGLMMQRLDTCDQPRLLPFGKYAETVTASPSGRWVATTGRSEEGRVITVASVENHSQRYDYPVPSRIIKFATGGDGRHLYALITSNDNNGLGDLALSQDAKGNLFRLTLPDSLVAGTKSSVADDAMHCQKGLQAIKQLNFKMPDVPPELSPKAVLSHLKTKDVRPVDLYFNDRDDLYALYRNQNERSENEGVIVWDLRTLKPLHQKQGLYIRDWSIRLGNGWGYYDDREHFVHEYLTGNQFPVNTKYEHVHRSGFLKSDPDTGDYFFLKKDHIEHYSKQGEHLADIRLEGTLADFTARNGHLAALFSDGKVMVWPKVKPTLSSPEIYKLGNSAQATYTTQLALSGDGQFLRVDSGGPDSPTEYAVYRLSSGESLGGGDLLAPLPRDANRGVVPGRYKYSLDVWDYDQGKVIARLPRHISDKTPYNRLFRLVTAISENGRYIASGNLDGTIRIWDLDEHRLIGEARAAKAVTQLAFNNNGSRLVAGFNNGNILLFDLSNQTDASSPDYQKNQPYTEKDFKRRKTVYAIASSVNVREAPLLSSPVIATVPIGQPVQYIDEQSGRSPNCRRNREPHSEGYRWICVRISDLESQQDYGHNYWVVADYFSSTKPDLDSILDYYRTIPQNKIKEQQKWLERAAALAPLNQEVHSDLIQVLTRANDEKALNYAQQAWENYTSPILPDSKHEQIFYVYDGHRIEKLLTIKNNKLIRHLDYSEDPLSLHKRADLFYLYTSQQENLGIVQTTIQHDCSKMTSFCPDHNSVRGLELSAYDLRYGVIASKEKISPPEQPIETKLTPQEHEFFVNALMQEAEKTSNDELKMQYLEQIKKGEFFVSVGRLSSKGKRFVITRLVVNSINDAHYSDVPYGVIFMLSEEQDDGSFVLSNSKDMRNLGRSGCNSARPFDFDQDGTDEILLYCEQLEGAYSYRVIQRNTEKWKIL